jgi:hypothetical protein
MRGKRTKRTGENEKIVKGHESIGKEGKKGMDF